MTVDPLTIRSLYLDLADAVALMPDISRAYSRLSQVFYRAVDVAMESSRVTFSGTFAKLDYLLKEHKIDRIIASQIHDTRTRIRMRTQAPESDLRQWFYYDLKSVALMVSQIFKINIPEALSRLFPGDMPCAYGRRRVVGDYLRAVVQTVDDSYIYCRTESYRDGATIKVCYVHGNQYCPGDWTYLSAMLSAGMQINIIRPRADGDVLYPEIVIVEPDQLINVSTVASCFTPYNESYEVDLLHRLQPQESTHATVLGNFASQLLDEAIHGSNNTYSDSIHEFFRNNALSLLGADIDSAQFHQEAKKQKENIYAAISTALPWTVSSFDPKEGIVEPSFVSEMLGLQGRMDFLQLDFKVLMEQKSGKGKYPYGQFVKPIFRTEHYVQMLLYMAVLRYNFNERYEANARELHSFLLYSKYKEGLVGLGFSPELLFRAFKIRNELAWANLQYTTEDGMRRLERLTADKLNRNNLRGKLWDQYIRPQIESTLSPIRKASPLERDYYFRMLRFLSCEYLTAKVGAPGQECSGFASTWLESVDDKLSAGNIYHRLTLVLTEAQAQERISRVVLKFDETDSCDMANFRKGDIVILYAYRAESEPDARKEIIFRCSIDRITSNQIELSLRAPQSDGRVFLAYRHHLWAIEHDFMEVSFASLFRGVHALLSAPKRRRDLVLMQREPDIDHEARLKGDYGTFNELMLRVKRAKDIYMIVGPPGTGKTSYGMLNTLKEQLLEADSSVLLASYTNRAVDEICSKLFDEGIDFIRIGSRQGCDDAYLPYMLSAKIETAGSLDDIKRIISTTRVFVGTTTAFNSSMNIFKLKRFSLAIIDEASQILEPHILGLLSACHDGESAIRKFVFIGDHKQLPAVVQQPKYMSEVHETSLTAIGLTDCRLSLFERLHSRYGADPNIAYMLNRQGRMHRDVAAYPNAAFYHGKLDVVPLPHQCGDIESQLSLTLAHRVVFIDVPAPADSPSDKVNLPEAELIATLVIDIYNEDPAHFSSNDTVGVIVPYRNQIAAVRNILNRMGIESVRDITVDTVERFQGSQRDNIIYGFTVQRLYQLDFLTDNRFNDADGTVIDRKLNVALTRARKRMILVGNKSLLRADSLFSQLIDFID